MEWVFGVFALLLVAGVVLSLRQWRSGRGKKIDARESTPQTEVHRERIRAEGDMISRHSFGGHSGDSDSH
ncbi:MAG: hypothetical protein AAF601_16085 [Pseudomonadota bacterium]